MSVDNLPERLSILAMRRPIRRIRPLPSSNALVTFTDRHIVAHLYAGNITAAPRRNIAIFGVFSIVPRLQITTLELFTKVKTPTMTVRPIVLFEDGVTFQEKPVSHLPAVTQDYQIAPVPVFPIVDVPTVPVSTYVEGWEVETITTQLQLSYTEGWEVTETAALVEGFTEGWEVTDVDLLVSYTELWEV